MTPKERRKFLAQFKAARRFVAQAKRWMGGFRRVGSSYKGADKMNEPIKLPKLPEPWNFTRPTVEAYARLAVEQATADLRAMLDRAIERLHAAEAALQPVKAERDEARAELARLTELLSDVRAVEAELAEKSDELARLTTLRPVSEWKEEDVVFWELYGPAEYARWRHSDAFHASHWTPLPDVKEIK